MIRSETLEAVSAVFCYKNQIFSVVRQNHLDVLPGYHTFPGGQIEVMDQSSGIDTYFPKLNQVHISALCREIREELSFDLEKAFSEGQLISIEPLAEIFVPLFEQIHFRNWFYRIDLKNPTKFILGKGKFFEGIWITPQNMLETFQQGRSLMVPPLRTMLRKLIKNPHQKQMGDLSIHYDDSKEIPEFEMLEGVRILMVPSLTLPPAERTNAFRLGDPDSPQILIDPSPGSKETFQVLLQQIKKEKLDALFLTHHHHDHHQYAPELARHLSLPIFISSDSFNRILNKFGNDYFQNIEMRMIQDGEEVTQWHGESVIVHAVPGHDLGQLALAPESLLWFIVGDLIQGIGTVVISEPEGDMANYFKTLEKVIELQPSVIIPSHGIPMGGTYRLEATLQHRKHREQQVLQLFKLNNTEDQMLESIYQNLPKILYPYALKNIRSHLQKLRLENLIP
jgi:endoribonuclease LACTB2